MLFTISIMYVPAWQVRVDFRHVIREQKIGSQDFAPFNLYVCHEAAPKIEPNYY